MITKVKTESGNNNAFKRVFVLFVFGVICVFVNAQTPQILYEWDKSLAPYDTTNFSVFDNEGNTIICKKGDIHDGLCVFRSKGKGNPYEYLLSDKELLGYANEEGKVVIPCQYKEAHPFQEELAAVRLGNEWFYIDKVGQTVITLPANCTRVGDFSNGMAPVALGERWGYIDRQGVFVIEPQYDFASSFREHKALVVKKDKWICIDEEGKTKFTTDIKYNQIEYVSREFNYGIVRLTKYSADYLSGTDFFFDTDGKEIGTDVWFFNKNLRNMRLANFGRNSLIEFIEKANAFADADMQMRIGNLYYVGISNEAPEMILDLRVKQDFLKAREWYFKAANNNNSRACFMLGWMYQHGQGVSQNNDVAINYYKRSSEPEAKKMLKELTAANAPAPVAVDTPIPQTPIVSKTPIQKKTKEQNIVDKSQPKNKGKRIALVIGNAEYQNKENCEDCMDNLKSPVNDANSIHDKLKELEFEVILVKNAKKEEMDKAIEEFETKVENYDVALFYYSGHGAEVDGINYLIPFDFYKTVMKNIDEMKRHYEKTCIVADNIMESLSKNTKGKLKIFILDTCRNIPDRRNKGVTTENTQKYNAYKDSYIMYATSRGDTALDGDGTDNSPFTKALLKALSKRLTLDETANEIGNELESKNEKTPEIHKQWFQDFRF